MSYLKASADLNLECPRGLPASSHIVDYHHRTNVAETYVICLKADGPREMKDQYPLLSHAQNQFWNEYHRHCELKAKVKDA